MSAVIERDFTFQAGVYFNDTVLLNFYEFTLEMIVNTEDIREQNIAMDRIKFLVEECLDSIFFIHNEEEELIEKFSDCGLRVCTIPEEPYDQIIALLLLYKFDTVCENKLKMVDIKLTSKLSDGVKFKENIETAAHTFSKDSWWSQNNYSFSKQRNTKGKVVKITNKTDWNDIGLSWKERNKKPTQIVFSAEPEK